MKMKFSPLKCCSSIKGQPICFIIFLGISCFITARLCSLTEQTTRHVISESHKQHNNTVSEINSAAHWENPSASDLARALSSSLDKTVLSFQAIQTKVAPHLFLALSTIPCMSQISYIGLNYLMFSYYMDGDQTLAKFSNKSFSSYWYTQPVNRDNGMLYGEAVSSKSMFKANESWFQETLNKTTGYHTIRSGWNKAEGDLYFDSVAMDGRGVISLGFKTSLLTDHFKDIDFKGGDFHLATTDGTVLVPTKIPDIQVVIGNNWVLLQTAKQGEPITRIGNVSCKSRHGKVVWSDVNVRGVKYSFHCSPLTIAKIQSVYVLAYPNNGLVKLVQKNSRLMLTLLTLMFVSVVISLLIFIYLIFKASSNEMVLSAALIKQMEATQQAERKSMNKSTAISSASHDVRAALAAITGLIELCREESNPGTDLAANLMQMSSCTKDLLGILNSVLDMSKIEAGKMLLENEDFNLAQLLEDVVDMFYPTAIKKGVDIVLDPCDGSIHKFSLVRGDRGRLKQILCNLLSNAVKFTSEGHISVRAVVKKPSFENVIIASSRKNTMKCCVSRLCYHTKEGLNELHTIHQNSNNMEFVFEVDDTGKGIPKDKQSSVFETYVQFGQEGSGLGLGIVQSLVRLMGGELKIVDKDPGERGTCFKFNIFLPANNPMYCESEDENRMHSDRFPGGFHQHFARHIWTPTCRLEGSQVVLLISSEERRRVLKKYIESLNIKVVVVSTDKNPSWPSISHPNYAGNESSIPNFLCRFASTKSDSGAYDLPKDANEQIAPHHKKSNSKTSSGFFLFVIDATSAATLISELCSAVSNFRKEIQISRCEVIGLDCPITRSTRDAESDMVAKLCDHVINKPLHGSRLNQVLGLLPELKGKFPFNIPIPQIKKTSQEPEVQHSLNPVSSTCHSSALIHSRSNEKPLSGKRVLVVDDVTVLRTLATTSLVKLGAQVESCENGKEAFDRVCKAFNDQMEEGYPKSRPYDYIFMDCEMPVMNGYEATKLIRKEEERYGVRIPIIALTAHAMQENVRKTSEAGMDLHLTKPLDLKELMDAIKSLS